MPKIRSKIRLSLRLNNWPSSSFSFCQLHHPFLMVEHSWSIFSSLLLFSYFHALYISRSTTRFLHAQQLRGTRRSLPYASFSNSNSSSSIKLGPTYGYRGILTLVRVDLISFCGTCGGRFGTALSVGGRIFRQNLRREADGVLSAGSSIIIIGAPQVKKPRHES